MNRMKALTLLTPIILLWAVFFNQQCLAQADTSRLIVLPQRQLKFSIAPVIYNRLNLDHQGKEVLRSRYTFSGLIGVGYYQQIHGTWGINVGAEMSVVPRNILIPYDIIYDTTNNAARLGDKFLWLNDYAYIHFTNNLAASVEKFFIKDEKTFYTIQTGVKINRLVAYPYEELGGIWVGDTTRLFDFYMENSYQRHFISYFIKAGLVKVTQPKQIYVKEKLKRTTKGCNTLHINLVINYSPQKIGKGWYRFYNFDFDSYGTVELGLNYIGLEFSYGLTLSKGGIKTKKRLPASP